MMSPIVINVPTRALLVGVTKGSFVRWLANLNIKRNLTSMFVNKYVPYNNEWSLFVRGMLKEESTHICDCFSRHIQYRFICDRSHYTLKDRRNEDLSVHD